MTSTQQQEGSEDVTDFLRRIKELEIRREREDNERTKQLEQDIIQGRKQREARRAERARSLSPEKGSPSTTSRSTQQPTSALSKLSSSPPDNASAVSQTTSPSLPSVADSVTPQLPPRSGVLSWQQRPSADQVSRSRSVRSRPPPSASTAFADPTEADATLSRAQIAQDLASRDPSWFRQTPDRGQGSAALRRNIQDTEVPSNDSLDRRELHGMSQNTTTSSNTDIHPRPLDRGSEQLSTAQITPDLNPSFPRSQLPPTSAHQELSTRVDLPSQLYERPLSPTKGLGGFAESAMLRRSESASKRSSVQISLPSTSTYKKPDIAVDTTTVQFNKPIEARPASPTRPRTPISSNDPIDSRGSEPVTTTSPSKRWSPNKSTWLESALKKPDSPTSKYAQSSPAWMSQLSKTKQEKVDRDLETQDNSMTVLPSPVNHELPAARGQFLSNSKQTSPPPPPPKPKTYSLTGSTVSSEAGTDHSQTASQSNPIKPAKPATPPKTDFRSQLKSTSSQVEKSAGEELEFRNAFVKLKRTQTEKYVAPDELKNNILRGKSALSATNGPQKSQRTDELKDSIVKQREAMKLKAQDSPSQTTLPMSQRKESIPEAIAKKKALGTPLPSKNSVESPKVQREVPKEKSPPTFNSALANIIARGPPSAPNRVGPMTATPSRSLNTPKESIETPPQAKKLEHMTKARAKGPKRRLPNAGTVAVSDSSKHLPVESPTSFSTGISSLGAISSESSVKAPSAVNRNAAVRSIPNPRTPPQSPRLNHKVEDLSLSKSLDSGPAVSTHAVKSRDELKQSPVRGKIPPWKLPSDSPTGQTPPKAVNTQNLQKDTPVSHETKPVEIKSSPTTVNNTRREEEPNMPDLPLSDASSSRINRSLPAAGVMDSKPINRSLPKPVRPAQSFPPGESENILAEFFGAIPDTPQKLDVDTKAVLLSNPIETGKIKTLRNQVQQMTSDGKMLPLPPQEEHIFFNDCMYVCTHEFEDPKGSRKSEAYLWIGELVGNAAVEDAQLFARKAAKQANAVLSMIRQGKEPPLFFQAIGGILVTRIGKNRTNAHLLCGRKHLGHLAFDEVPLSASSLCSGFAYILSSASGRVYLWKGKGCSTEELAAARLLSMDTGSSTEVLEIEESKEPSEFFTVFATSEQTIPRSAEHWKLKAAHENYSNRLFQVEHSERPLSRQNSGSSGIWNLVRRGSQADLKASKQTQIREISPFMQSDLRNENVYVLDAFFELYIILGCQSYTKPEAFGAALLFAQEYASLSASADNRPHLPVATVVIEGVPRDMKRVFRKWDDSLVQPGSTQSTGSRGKTLKIMPLPKALAALRSER